MAEAASTSYRNVKFADIDAVKWSVTRGQEVNFNNDKSDRSALCINKKTGNAERSRRLLATETDCQQTAVEHGHVGCSEEVYKGTVYAVNSIEECSPHVAQITEGRGNTDPIWHEPGSERRLTKQGNCGHRRDEGTVLSNDDNADCIMIEPSGTRASKQKPAKSQPPTNQVILNEEPVLRKRARTCIPSRSRVNEAISWSLGDRTDHSEVATKYDVLFKFFLIGDSYVGKTSLLCRYLDKKVPSTHVPTLGIDLEFKTVELRGKLVRLQLWDTAGQERFGTLTTQFYREVQGILLMYDISNTDSFKNLQKWMSNISENADSNVKIVMVGNKCDIDSGRQVTPKQGKQLASEYGMRFIECSATRNVNVDQAFEMLVEEVMTPNLAKPRANKKQASENTVHLKDEQPSGIKAWLKKKCC